MATETLTDDLTIRPERGGPPINAAALAGYGGDLLGEAAPGSAIDSSPEELVEEVIDSQPVANTRYAERRGHPLEAQATNLGEIAIHGRRQTGRRETDRPWDDSYTAI